MKANRIIIALVMLMAGMSSCQDWFDVSPKADVKAEDMFEAESGFRDILTGVYGLMIHENLYGRQLTFGYTDVLAQYYNQITTQEHEYIKTVDFKYNEPVDKAVIEKIWSTQYKAIANLNTLLAYIDKKQEVFSSDAIYRIYKGEALALRAFLHFDLLRLFGASYAENPKKAAIPYVMAYTSNIYPQDSVGGVITKVLGDLTASLDYLKNDPILTGKNVTETDDNGYLLNRQVHLNYYAVKGLMARVYLYKKDYQNAALCASEVIESGRFEWVKQENLTNAKMADLTFSTEHLFALNVVNLGSRAEKYFTGGNLGFALDETNLLEYYESAQDYRYLYQFKSGTGLSNS